MKPATTALINYLNAVIGYFDGEIIFADAFVFALRGGAVLCYTNSDVGFAFTDFSGASFTALANSVLVDGLKYKASIGLEVDTQQITLSALSTDTIGSGASVLQALRDGSFDGCEVTRYRAFFSDRVGGTFVGAVMLFKGRFGKIDELGRTTAKITVNSDLVLLDIDMPRNLYQPTCLHTLYDSGCTLAKASFSTAGTVGAGSTFSTVNWSGASANYQQGTITFTSGVNDGVSTTVGAAVVGISLSLIYPLEAAPAPGDTFSIAFGCDHTPGTCNSKFNNLKNFRGFPYVPPPQMAI
jgi:uncharacterized phage protein (TIGR02218 family)